MQNPGFCVRLVCDDVPTGKFVLSVIITLRSLRIYLCDRVLGKFAAAATAGGAALVVTAQTATCSDTLHATQYPWSHNGMTQAYDAASIRRGHQVYAEVCAACHGLKRIAYRNLVGVCYTEDEAKQMASDKEYQDGPDDTGQLPISLRLRISITRSSLLFLLCFLVLPHQRLHGRLSASSSSLHLLRTQVR